MKFKYIGENNTYCLELLAYNIMSKKDNLKKGQVIEVPDENATLINALNTSGVFVKLDFNKNTTKKNKKGE
jgi:DNA-directed RNA polymerase subunit L